MNAYYDTGVLVPLYVPEVFSASIATLVESRRGAIPYNLLQQLELETALRLKFFRGEIDGARIRAFMENLDADVRSGRLVLRTVDWMQALEEARRIGAQATGRWGCRTLDLLHVAIAVQWQSAVFVSADERQLRAARAASLKTIDVRTFAGDRPGGASSRPAAGAIREKRARYGASRKRRAASPHRA